MTALAKGRNISERLGNIKSYPNLTNAVLYRGGLAAITTAGRATAGATGASLLAVGVVEPNMGLKGASNVKGTEVWDFTSVASDAIRLLVKEGVFPFFNSSSADEITQDDVGKPCWMVDDQTVALTSNNRARSGAGYIVDVDSDGTVWVDVSLKNSIAIAAAYFHTCTLSAADESANAIVVSGQVVDNVGNPIAAAVDVVLESIAPTANKGQITVSTGTAVANEAAGASTKVSEAVIRTNASGVFVVSIADDQAENVTLRATPNNGRAVVQRITFA